MPQLVHIYKHAGGDSSNAGISSRCDDALAFGPNEPFDMAALSAERKFRYVEAIRICKGNIGGSVVARPIDPATGGELRGMFGGCHVDSSDARFGTMIDEVIGEHGAQYRRGAIALHDRFEW